MIGSAVLVAVALVAAACGDPGAMGEVSAGSAEFGASLETSTTLGDGPAGITRRFNTGNPREDAARNLLAAIAEDPSLLDDIENLTPEELEELTGLESEELGTLGITPGSVAALGGVIRQIGPEEQVDPALAAAVAAGGGTLLNESGQLTAEARGLLGGIDPATLAVLIATSLQVGPDVTNPLGEVLAVLDPSGLGQFQDNQSALAVIAVVMAAILGEDPETLLQLQNVDQLDPNLRYLVNGLTGIARGLRPEFIDSLNRINGVLGPYALRAIGAAVGLLQNERIADQLAIAFADEVVVSTAVGSMILLIPGLPQLVAPQAFAKPESIYPAVLGVMAAALVNMDAPGFRDFLTTLGVDIPPELLN